MADTPTDTQSKMQAAVDLLVQNSTPEQVADALYEGHMAAFHRREAAINQVVVSTVSLEERYNRRIKFDLSEMSDRPPQ